MQNFRRFLAAFSCLIVGASSFALSFVAIRDVSIAVGAVPEYLGFLLPVVIDGGIICGSAVIWSLSRESTRRPLFPFIFVGLLVLVSVLINTNHAGPTLLAKVIAALPPLILLGTLELVAAQGRRLSSISSLSQTSEHPFNGKIVDSASLPTTNLTDTIAQVGSKEVPEMPLQHPSASTTAPVEVQINLPSPIHASYSVPSTAITSHSQIISHSPLNDSFDGELEQLVESFGESHSIRTRKMPNRRAMRVRAEKPLI